MSFKFPVMALLFVSLLPGCSKEPPKCSDESTFAIVKTIVIDQVASQNEQSEKNDFKEYITFSLPRATGFDEKIKKYSCEANMTVGGTYEIPIAYESQLDDKNEHIVFVQRSGRGDLVQIATALIKAKEVKAATTQASLPSSDGRQVNPATAASTSTPGGAQCFSEIAITKAISELDSYKDVGPSVNCGKEVYGVGKLICSNNTLKLMDLLDTKAYVYAFENSTKSQSDHSKPAVDSAWLSSVRNECKDEACLCAAFKAHTNSSLGGSSPYPQ